MENSELITKAVGYAMYPLSRTILKKCNRTLKFYDILALSRSRRQGNAEVRPERCIRG